MSKRRYAVTVDTKVCVGCNACVLACKGENKVPENGFRCWIETETQGKFPVLNQEIRSVRCNQCSDAPSVAACPTGASHYSDGGIVAIDKDKCTGCKACIAACPYGARYVHKDGYTDKCNFCLHRVREGRAPACTSICPTSALTFGDAGDPDSLVSRQLRTRRFKRLKEEQGLEPNVYFLV